ncbi:MAG TPA: tetratricopeptide repeat protein [candidate division Zixibacteria bacterium]|nr:tetratricopeptide repeat protein [candidate division Zixibacteria bacterium]
MTRFYRVLMLAIIAIGMLAVSQRSNVEAFGSEKKTAQDSVNTATEHYNSGVDHMDKASAILKRGDSAFAYNYRATSDAKAKKEYEKAVKEFDKALKTAPDMKEAYNNLGFCYRKLGQLDESLTAYTSALAIDPDFARAREYLGETYLAMAQVEKANEQLNLLKQLKSPFADTLQLSIASYNLATINEKMRDSK